MIVETRGRAAGCRRDWVAGRADGPAPGCRGRGVEAEDLSRDAVMRPAGAIASHNGAGCHVLRAFVDVVASDAMRRTVRKRRSTRRGAEKFAAAPAPAIHEAPAGAALAAGELRERTGRALAILAPRQRRIVDLMLARGVNHGDLRRVADELGVSRQRAHQHWRGALARLAVVLGPPGEE